VQKKRLIVAAIIIALENDMHLPSQARDKHRESTQKEEERHVCCMQCHAGIGPALSELDDAQRATLRDMYETLPWFTAVVDVVDRVIAMCEPDIAANYDKQVR